VETVIAAAAAHHRLAWIHPFLGGNGALPVCSPTPCCSHARHRRRLVDRARPRRNVQAYKGHLAACDQTRRNDLDGRGHLSEENLVSLRSSS